MVEVVVAAAFVVGCIFGSVVSEFYNTKNNIKTCENCKWMHGLIGPNEDPEPSLKETISEPSTVQGDYEDCFPKESISCTVDVDGLIFTESGGNPNAVGDGGKSKGLGQMSRAAWKDVEEWCNISLSYDAGWSDPTWNRWFTYAYVNRVIPEKYFRTWNIQDSVHARIAAYKHGPARFRDIYEWHGETWMLHVADIVRRDLEKYEDFVGNLR